MTTAQQTDATLQSLTRMALERNPEIRALLAAAQAAEQRGAQVGGWSDPEIMVQWFANPAQGGGPLRRSAFGVRQMMPWPGTLPAARAGAAAGARARWHALEVARVQLTLAVAETWHARHGQARRIRLIQEHLEWIARLEALARQRHALGLVSQAELLRIEIEREEMRSDLRMANLMAQTLDVKLRGLLNVSDNSTFPTPNGAQPQLQFTPDPAQVGHPMLLEAGSMVQEAEAMARQAKLETRPMFGVGLDIMGPEYSMMESSFAWPIVPSLSVTLPIWRSKTQAMRKEAALRVDVATARIDAATNTIFAERAEAKLMLDQAQESVDLYQKRLIPRATSMADLILLEYSTGKRLADEVIDARRMALDLSIKLEEALTQRNSAVIRLQSLYPGSEN